MIYHNEEGTLTGLREAVSVASLRLASERYRFDGFVVMGMSGVIVGVPVALNLGMSISILRKDSDDTVSKRAIASTARVDGGSYTSTRTHVWHWIERPAMGARLIFLDDFIQSGTTKRRVEQAASAAGATIIGHYLYRDDVVSYGS